MIAALRLVVAVVILGASAAGSWWLLRQPEPEGLTIPGRTGSKPPMAKTSGPPVVDASSQLALAADSGGVVQPDPMTEALCPGQMVWVGGQYCPRVGPEGRCNVASLEIGVCMDVYEYPNQVGVLPAVMLHFDEAQRSCAAEGKRLCTEAEWSFACRGVQTLSECNFGRTAVPVRVEDYWDPARVSEALARQDGRRRSGQGRCVSASAAHDLLGNVQEWVLSEHPGNYRAALKGGGYSQAVVDCQRSIQTRRPHQRLPHTGFRCCQPPLVVPPAGQAGP